MNTKENTKDETGLRVQLILINIMLAIITAFILIFEYNQPEMKKLFYYTCIPTLVYIVLFGGIILPLIFLLFLSIGRSFGNNFFFFGGDTGIILFMSMSISALYKLTMIMCAIVAIGVGMYLYSINDIPKEDRKYGDWSVMLLGFTFASCFWTAVLGKQIS